MKRSMTFVLALIVTLLSAHSALAAKFECWDNVGGNIYYDGDTAYIKGTAASKLFQSGLSGISYNFGRGEYVLSLRYDNANQAYMNSSQSGTFFVKKYNNSAIFSQYQNGQMKELWNFNAGCVSM